MPKINAKQIHKNNIALAASKAVILCCSIVKGSINHHNQLGIQYYSVPADLLISLSSSVLTLKTLETVSDNLQENLTNNNTLKTMFSHNGVRPQNQSTKQMMISIIVSLSIHKFMFNLLYNIFY